MKSEFLPTVRRSALAATAFALVFSAVSIGFSAYQSFEASDYAYPKSGGTTNLNATLWNKVVDNIVDLDSKISNFSFSGGSVWIGALSSSASLAVSWATILDAGNSRPISIGGNYGSIVTQGDSGGWAFGYNAKWSSGSSLWGFGFLGSGDTISNYYVGTSYSNPTVIIQPNNGNVWIGAAPTSYKLSVNGSVNATGTCLAGSCLSAWGDVFWGSFTTSSTNCPALNNPKTGGQSCPSWYSAYVSARAMCNAADAQVSYTYVCMKD